MHLNFISTGKLKKVEIKKNCGERLKVTKRSMIVSMVVRKKTLCLLCRKKYAKERLNVAQEANKGL